MVLLLELMGERCVLMAGGRRKDAVEEADLRAGESCTRGLPGERIWLIPSTHL